MKLSPKLIEQISNKYPQLPLRAAFVADFIESHCTVKSKGQRSPFVLLGWQLECLAGIYTGKPGDIRDITRALISMARKNGKTEFASALVLVHLAGPEAPAAGGQVICAAAMSQDQASLCFDGAVEMAKASPALRKHMTFRTNRLIWKVDKCNNYAKTISKSASSAQGLRPSFFVYDEIAESTDRTHWESLNYAQTDDTQGGLGIIISTKSNKPNSLFAILENEIVKGQETGINHQWFIKVYAADNDAGDLYTMEQVKKANPALDVIVPSKMIEAELENAKANPTARPEFNARRLNLHTGSNASLIDGQLWMDAGEDPAPAAGEVMERFKGKKVVLGMDLGSTTSMTSLGVWFPTERYFTAIHWFAKSQIKHNETLHKIPYSSYAKDGYLNLIEDEVTGGMTYAPIADKIIEIFENYDVLSFRYDGWNCTRLFHELKDRGMDHERAPLGNVKDKFIQGTQSYGEAILELEDMMMNSGMTHDNNPVTNFSVMVCEVQVDNRATETLKKPIKNTQQLPNDAAVAMLMAISKRGIDISTDPPDDDWMDKWYDAW